MSAIARLNMSAIRMVSVNCAILCPALFRHLRNTSNIVNLVAAIMKYSIARIKSLPCRVAKASDRTPFSSIGADAQPSIRLKTLKTRSKLKLQLRIWPDLDVIENVCIFISIYINVESNKYTHNDVVIFLYLQIYVYLSKKTNTSKHF